MLCSITISVLSGESPDTPGEQPLQMFVLKETEGSCGTGDVQPPGTAVRLQDEGGCYTSTDKTSAGSDKFIQDTVTTNSKFRKVITF